MRFNNKISSVITLLTCGVVLWSCTRQDYDVAGHCRNISFAAAAVDELRSADSLAVPSEKTTNITPLHIEGDGADQIPQLYLHEIVSDMGTALPFDRASDVADSRAITVLGADDIGSFHISAVYYPKSSSFDQAKTSAKYLFRNLKVDRDAYGFFPTSYHWPGSKYNVSFFAFAPSSFSLNDVMGSRYKFGWSTIGLQSTDRATDILVATVKDVEGIGTGIGKPQPLTFKHILAGIRFVVDDGGISGRVTKIILHNIHFSGTYDLISNSWKTRGGAHGYYPIAQEIIDLVNAGHSDANKNPQLLFLPQDFEDNSTIEIEMTVGGVPISLSANLKTDNHSGWSAGKVTTYKITAKSIVEENTFDVALNGVQLSTDEQTLKTLYAGARLPLDVRSTSELRKGGRTISTQDKPWHIEWFDPSRSAYRAEAFPDWIIRAAGSIAIGPQTAMTATEYLRSKPFVGNPRDLSILNNPKNKGRADGAKKQSTANCYVITEPGTYTIPNVYGNGIVDGANNSSSWGKGDSDQYRLKRFKKHNNDEILYHPKITDNTVVANKKPLVVWEDHPGMITDAKVTANDYIQFTVTKENIRQGNALIALRGGSNANATNVLWSWHIWILPTDLWEDEVEGWSGSGNEQVVTKLPLGWTDDSAAFYPEREIRLRFVQEGTNQYRYARVLQPKYYKPTRNGKCTYYQWGRKDPFLPGQKPITTDYVWITWNLKGRYIYNGILYPDYYFHSPDFWAATEEKYYNLWDNTADNVGFDPYDMANNGKNRSRTTQPIKTIYDPSPVGFVVPATGFFQYNPDFIRHRAREMGGKGYITNVEQENGVPVFTSSDELKIWSAFGVWEGGAAFGSYYGWAASDREAKPLGSFRKDYPSLGFPIFSMKEDWWTK